MNHPTNHPTSPETVPAPAPGTYPTSATLLGLTEPLLAAAVTWCALLSWRGLAESPGTVTAPLALAGLLVAVLGWALRQVTGRWWVVLLIQTVVVWCWLQHRVTERWLPGPQEARVFWAWLAAGADAGQRYVSPVSTDHPAFGYLLLASGTGLFLLVDFLACTLGRAPLAGLPLLLVITISASLLLQPVTWLIFAGAALGWLVLIAWQESLQIRRWAAGPRAGPGDDAGKDPEDDPGDDADAGWAPHDRSLERSLGSMSLRIGVLCALVAIVPTTLMSSEGRQLGSIGQGPGAGSIIFNNPLLNMRQDLTTTNAVPLVSVRTEKGTPSYLRTTVLDVFTGTVWRPGERTFGTTGELDGRLPPAPGLAIANTGSGRTWSIQVASNYRSKWLPLPFPAAEVDVGRGWRYDPDTLDVVGERGTDAADLGYRATALPVTVEANAMRVAGTPPAAVKARMTRLPPWLPPDFARVAQQVTAGADNDFDRAVALQDWFRDDSRFTYSLEPREFPGSGAQALARFITTERSGYCEQFATAMAIMARSLGIPARVATGFLRGEKDGRQYVFTARDLHAWPELYFRGVGWIRFEPTPAQRTGQSPSYTRERASGQVEAAPEVTEAPSALPSRAAPADAPDASAGGDDGQGISPLTWAVGLVALLLLALAGSGPRLVRRWRSRRRWARAGTVAALAEAAWDEVEDTAQDLDLGWDRDATVRENRRAVHCRVSATAEADEALGRVARFVETARYARPTEVGRSGSGGVALAAPRTLEEVDVRAEVERWQQELQASIDPRRARRARWFPRSVLRR